jgi:hypothetical protein
MVALVRKRRGRGWGLGRTLCLQRPQGVFQGLDRVGPLGGQVLGGSAAGPLKRQGMLEFSNPVSSRLGGPSAPGGLVMLLLVGCAGLA